MRKVFSFVKGKKDDKKENKLNPQISVEITNPSGQRITSDDEHIVGLQQGNSYEIDFAGKDKSMSKLHKAAWTGNLDKVKLNAKKIDVNTVDNSNRTPLHLAAAQGHTEIVWFLVNNNATLEVCDTAGFTPFLKAVECGNKDCVNLLIECGANINALDLNGNNALHLASSRGYCNIASVLLKEGVTHSTPNTAGEFAMHIATGADHRDLVELLVRGGAGVEPWDKERRTPLMIAARAGHASLARLLVAHGATLSAVDSNGWSAEDYAQFGGHQELTEMLKPTPPPQPKPSDTSQSSESQAKTEKSGEGVSGEEEMESVCIIPPPLEPPRSWDLIKSGAIQQGEAERPNLLPLNTDCEQTSLTDLSPTTPFQADETRLSPIPPENTGLTPERRSRSPLERAHSLDLPSDHDSPIMKTPESMSTLNNELNSSTEVINDSIVVADEIIDVHLYNDNTPSQENETVIIDNNENEEDEEKEIIFERSASRDKSVDSNENENIACELINGNASSTSIASPMDCSQSFENLDAKSSDFNSDAPGSFDNLDDLPERSLSIEIIQSTGKLDDTLEVCTIKGVFKESQSLDMLEFGDEGGASRASIKRHSRNRSITLATQPQFWKSVDVIYGSSPCGVAKPSDIDSQLQCYDEALRQLAKVNMQKPTPPDSRKETPRSSFKQSSQESIEEIKECPVQMKDVAVSGPSSLETDREDSFPPPPVYFMEGEENEIIELPGEDSIPMPFPISMLTPIKENYLEQDSLSAVEPGDNDSIEEVLMKTDVDLGFHSDPGTSKVSVPIGKNSSSLNYPNIIPCHLDGGDLFLTDKDLSRYYPNFVEINTLHLQNERRLMQEGPSPQKSPLKLKRSEKVRSADYEGIAKFDIGGACLSRVNEVLKKRKEQLEEAQEEREEEESDDSKEDPPFWMSGKVGACLSRQNTVISVNGSTPTSAHIKFDYGAGPSNKLEPDLTGVRTRESESPRSEAETASASDTPKIMSKFMEGGCVPVEERLEGILGDRLHDPSKQTATITILRTELAKVETKYTQAQEELVNYRQRAISAERDLAHLRQLHSKLTEEKTKLYQELTKHLKGLSQERDKGEFSDDELSIQLKILEEENQYEREKNKKLENYLEEVLSANRCMMTEREALIAQNITDVKKLQEDTLCWKERYEECAAKLELMERNQDPRLIEAQDTIETLKRTISILQQEKSTPSLTKHADAWTFTGHEGSSFNEEDKPKSSIPSSDSEIQIADLEKRLKEEATKRATLETQVAKLLTELQDRYKLEAELGRVHERLEREFVSKSELEHLRFKNDEALTRVKKEAVRESEVNVSAKIAEINKALQTQINEQARLDRERTKSEATLKKEVEKTRQSLLVELGKLQSELKAKEFEENIIRQKCEKLTREIERIQDMKHRSLIEKSLSINLADLSPSRISSEADNSYIQSAYENRGKTLPLKNRNIKEEKK